MSSRHIFYGGNGTVPVDSGLPDVGRFFVVGDNGDLIFFHYTGRGEEDPTGTLGFDPPHQATVIGNGFGDCLHLLGGGDGIILAIMRNGDLTFFRYTGKGEPDRTGRLGFDPPHQGTVIGNGFHTFPHVFVSPREGRTAPGRPPATTIFTVAENGDLRFFRYTGNGEHDPSGTLGFEGPNQGNQIGNGFTGLDHVVGIGGGVFLAVPTTGELRFFHYTGNGEHDPTGTLGFVGNSGNQIGRGFNGLRHMFGGTTDRGGFGRIIHTVDAGGALRYFRYTGKGEHDQTGTLGFESPNQGNQIGRGF